MSGDNCTACGGIGSECLNCNEPLDECECGPDAEPSPCLQCDGMGWEPEDPYGGSTAAPGDVVRWKDPQRGDTWDDLEVTRTDAKAGTLTVRGWFGRINKQGGETMEIKRLRAAECSVMRRSM